MIANATKNIDRKPLSLCRCIEYQNAFNRFRRASELRLEEGTSLPPSLLLPSLPHRTSNLLTDQTYSELVRSTSRSHDA